jgi:hypothetical protein
VIREYAREVARVVRALPGVERARRREGPQPIVARLRAAAERAPERDAAGRARLRRAIGWIDRAVPGGPNCLRRVLLETALDRGAAREPIVIGLSVNQDVGDGHAWLGAPRPSDRAGTYQLEIRL